jgi:hypothetical protein
MSANEANRQDLSLGSRVSPFVARSPNTGSLAKIALEFLNGPSQTSHWPMNRVMSLVGSAAGNKFRLADPSVSPFHCSLLRTRSGLWVVDLLSLEGLAVNDAPVRYTMLVDGDVLKVGRYRIRIHSEPAHEDLELPKEFDRRPASVAAPALASRTMAEPIQTKKNPAIPVAHLPHAQIPNGSLTNDQAPNASAVQSTRLECNQGESRELVPLEKSEFAELERIGLTEAALVPLVNQFGMMQQQMLDQFQQAISMLVQMFGSLHRDQMSVIREELDQLRDLTEELHSLKRELANRSQEHRETLPAAGQTATGEDGRQRLLESIKERVETASRRPSTPLEELLGSVPSLVTASKAAPDPPKDSTHGESSQSPEGLPSVPEEQAATAKIPWPLTAPASRLKRDSDRDATLWLHQRMIALHEERETRWQKIMKLLPGAS